MIDRRIACVASFPRLGRLCLLALVLPAAASSSLRAGDDLAAWTEAAAPELLKMYRHLHQHPELSYREEKTAAYLAKRWRAIGLEVTEHVGGHGVVGVLENGHGPCLLLRTDTDALPVTERTGLAYASTVEVDDGDGGRTGVMHACGHDMHMAVATGAARYLIEHRSLWQGKLVVIGQPAEERGAGAKAMLADGLFERFGAPDAALALHCAADMPVGQVGYRGGFSMANVDSVDITIKGRGGHGAYPHTTIDPVVIAAKLIVDLQTIVAREVDPSESAVITVGSIHGGTKHNVIPDACQLQLTVRSYKDEVRSLLKEAIRRKAEAAAASAGAPDPVVEYSEGTPSLYNDPELTQAFAEELTNEFGADSLVRKNPSMGGEDFSRYGDQGARLCMLWLGCVDPQRMAGFARFNRPPPSLHSAEFYPDAAGTLPYGVRSLVVCALRAFHDGETAASHEAGS